jgi:hypothetical protein
VTCYKDLGRVRKFLCSTGLARDEDNDFYWIETLENYLHIGPKSREGTFAQGGGVDAVSSVSGFNACTVASACTHLDCDW